MKSTDGAAIFTTIILLILLVGGLAIYFWGLFYIALDPAAYTGFRIIAAGLIPTSFGVMISQLTGLAK